VKVKKERKHLNKRTKGKIKKNNIFLLLIILVVVVYLAPKLFSAAKYIYSSVQEYYLSSKDFYFASDKLSSSHTEYEITNNWSGAETYIIAVNMSSKKNDMAFTAADIEYTISYTCSDNISCKLSKTSGTIVGQDNGGVNEDSFSINIDPANGTALNEGEKAWVEVTATSKSPYKQTISGKLILEVGNAEISYEIIDSANSPYLTVNITNSQSKGADVTLAYSPSVVLLDMTSRFYLNSTSNKTEKLNNYAYINSITSYVDSLTTTSVKFYKMDKTQDYSYSNENGVTPVITLSY